MDAISKTVRGKYNRLEMVNPYNCYFIANYSAGKVVQGKNIIDTGWDNLQDGIESLSYKLSTGRIIQIPKFKAYLHLVEVSQTLETGAKVFHNIHIKGLTFEGYSVNYRIVLKQDQLSKHKIGDVIITKEDKVVKSPHWKMAA